MMRVRLCQLTEWWTFTNNSIQSLASNPGSAHLNNAIDIDARSEAFQLAGLLLTSQDIFLTFEEVFDVFNLREAVSAATRHEAVV